ncbi:hypothetical protein BDB00DRAFT_784246 [Zychaea mexicana]|uniref:uncharacterized protein n=1 Tax=Zychaea mexicana TaxID=64656 RepID=UPI0022FDEDFE|nr:uncharacterized protein BDB00DRAFT_784246 [Zychaea mexicana]KAI9498182.1 hypothetical protein BDB00DRAFT_784246 [Zychaea mexicana]
MSQQQPEQDISSYLAESTLRIKDLHEAEKKLVLLVESAGDAMAILCDDSPQDQDADQVVRNEVVAFRELAARYFTLVNDIQLSLRSNTHYLRKSGSIAMNATRSIPFRESVSGEQKELEVWTAAVEMIHQRVQELKRIAEEHRRK